MSKNDIRQQRLGRTQARKLISKIVTQHPHRVFYTKHCRKELLDDDLTTSDLLNVLTSSDSRIEDEPEIEGGSYRYRLETNKIMVVLAFSTDTSLVVITAWRK